MHGPMNDISFILLTLQFQQCQIIKITEQLLIKTVVLLLLLLLLFGFRTEYEEDKKKMPMESLRHSLWYNFQSARLYLLCINQSWLNRRRTGKDCFFSPPCESNANSFAILNISAILSVCRWNISSPPFCLQPIFVCSLTSPTSTDTMHIWYASRVPHTSSTHFH